MVPSSLSELSKMSTLPPADNFSSSLLGAAQYVLEGVASSEVCQNTHSVRRVFSIVRFTPLQPNHNEIPIKMTENGSVRKGYGRGWSCIQFHELACSFTSLHTVTYACMQFHELSYSYISSHAVPKEGMQFYDLTCRSMIMHVVPLVYLEFYKLCCSFTSLHTVT